MSQRLIAAIPAAQGSVAESGAIRLRVRYCECDPMGVAHHGSYVAWLEMGRTELLRPSGVSYADLEQAGVLLAVTRLDIRYKQPARYDEEVELRTRVSGGGRARIDHEYELFRVGRDGRAGDLLAVASSTLACIGRDGRPRALPGWLTPARRATRERAGSR